jgi:hypothetical protein
MANEKRLIDCIEFAEKCERLLEKPPFVHPATPWDRGLLLAVETALCLPKVDAVEVVRCKNCMYWSGYGGRCKHWGSPLAGTVHYTNAEDFCSYGERRTE